MTVEKIIDRLKEGNQRFVEDALEGKLQKSPRRLSLIDGQSPHTIVLGCADSRIIPELAFDMGIGELFVVRVAGNIANLASIASIEYAVIELGSKVIVVLGHESCGAVTAAVKGGDYGHNLNQLLAHISPAINRGGKNASLSEIIKLNTQISAKELVDRSKIISKAIEANELKIITAHYCIESGKIQFLD